VLQKKPPRKALYGKLPNMHMYAYCSKGKGQKKRGRIEGLGARTVSQRDARKREEAGCAVPPSGGAASVLDLEKGQVERPL